MFISIFPIIIATTAGLSAADPNAVRLCRSLTASEWQIFTNVRFPSALPYIFSGMKIGITLSIIGVIIGEFITSQRFGIEQVARIFNVPPALIAIAEPLQPGAAENLADHFLKFHLAPRLRRIEKAFRADAQLFGPGAQDLRVEFLADAILRPTTKDRYEAYLKGRQAGWLTANQIRELENMPPIDQAGADELQTTPVGGAPNLQPGAPQDTPEDAA